MAFFFIDKGCQNNNLPLQRGLTQNSSFIMKTQFTKDVSVERVTPPALLGYCKAVGLSEREERSEFAQEFDNAEKAKWRTALFVRYADRLLECSERIFADERLFYTPLPLPLKVWAKSGRSYAPIKVRLTLGHVLAWWQNYKCAQVESEGGELHYIYAFDITTGKFGFPTKPYRVGYIGDDGQGYHTEVSTPIPELGYSLYEVSSQYGSSELYFELEDAIEHLFGEKVYQRL